MIAFLTSTLGDFYLMDEMVVDLVSKNDFTVNLRKIWKRGSKGLFISADPSDFSGNDRMRDEFFRAFRVAGLAFERLDICDGRMREELDLSDVDVIILGGGHVPTQHKFFEQISLREHLKSFNGILLSLSAGSMNCAELVYSIPELEGEALDPNYNRWLNGLGITKCMMIPHYQYFKDVHLDGKHVIHDIAIPDSAGKKFYALPDGSYIVCTDGKEYLYGEGHLISDGATKKICSDGEFVELHN